MLGKIVLQLWSARKEFVKYFTIGISAYLADIGSLWFLKEKLGFSAILAVIINQPILILTVFYLNKRWSFRSTGLTTRQIIRFFILAGCNYVFSVIWIYVLHDKLAVQYLTARTANIALSVGWNFLLYKHWVYRS
jgi:putative flippase GtrA